MRKTLMPLVASLALCGGVTGLLIATNANAAQQAPAKPVMLALATPQAEADTAMPPPEGGDAMRPRLAQFCKDMYAHKVGEMAFLETKLSLTPAQTPLFDKWKRVSLDTARQRQDTCLNRPAHMAGKRPTLPDRLAMEEQMLKTRLTDLQAERPALTALYAALTPQQQAELGHGDRPMRRHMGMMGPRGPMMGPMGHGPEDAPPPPPAQ